MPENPLHLSYDLLTLLATNPLKFQQHYLEQGGLSSPPINQQQQELGSHFHLVMRQLLMGLPVEPLLNAYPQLGHWVNSLWAAAPEIFAPPADGTFKECEYPCTIMLEGHLLAVVYDLLIADEDSAQIIEWTTARIPDEPKLLEHSLKTRLYLYVLVESSDYEPDQVSMTYWFVQPATDAQSFKFSYSIAQHERTHLELCQLLSQLNRTIQELQPNGKLASAVQKESPAPQSEEIVKNLEEIAEVPI